jgi:hypothetical protein
MTDCVTGGVDDIERTIAKEIVSLELANLDRILKINLA